MLENLLVPMSVCALHSCFIFPVLAFFFSAFPLAWIVCLFTEMNWSLCPTNLVDTRSYKEVMPEFGFEGDLGYVQLKVRVVVPKLRLRFDMNCFFGSGNDIFCSQATMMPYMADPQIQMNYNAASYVPLTACACELRT